MANRRRRSSHLIGVASKRPLEHTQRKPKITGSPLCTEQHIGCRNSTTINHCNAFSTEQHTMSLLLLLLLMLMLMLLIHRMFAAADADDDVPDGCGFCERLARARRTAHLYCQSQNSSGNLRGNTRAQPRAPFAHALQPHHSVTRHLRGAHLSLSLSEPPSFCPIFVACVRLRGHRLAGNLIPAVFAAAWRAS